MLFGFSILLLTIDFISNLCAERAEQIDKFDYGSSLFISFAIDRDCKIYELPLTSAPLSKVKCVLDLMK